MASRSRSTTPRDPRLKYATQAERDAYDAGFADGINRSSPKPPQDAGRKQAYMDGHCYGIMID